MPHQRQIQEHGKLPTMNAPLPKENLVPEKKIYSGQAARIMKLLGHGLTDAEASRAVGCDASYISQLKAEDDFMIQVNELITQNFEQDTKIAKNYREIEEKMSERLLGNTAHLFDTDKILRTLKFVAEQNRKVTPSNGSNGSGPNGGNHLDVAILVLPSQVAAQFVKNPMGEVVSIDGTALVTLPSAQMSKLAENTKLNSPKLIDKRPNGPRHQDPYSDL